eukprot:1576129-Lingulodinium_polyedra.AAC.1
MRPALREGRPRCPSPGLVDGLRTMLRLAGVRPLRAKPPRLRRPRILGTCGQSAWRPCCARARHWPPRRPTT